MYTRFVRDLNRRRSWLAPTFALAISMPLHAEIFRLQSGGELRGELLNADQKPRSTYVIALETGGKLAVDAREVTEVVALSDKQQEYQTLLTRMPADTAANHWSMAQWCQREGLPAEREFHLRQVIRLDPDHELARRALKYKRQDDGGWARRDEIMQDRGLVQEGGRWETPQEARLRQRQEAREESLVQWRKDLKMWRGWLGGRNHRQAVQNILAIRDPLAAEPLGEMFFEEQNVELRESLAEILGRLESSVATQALAQAALEAGDAELRIFCVKQLSENSFHTGSAARLFISQLKGKNNQRVNRAAAALGRLGDASAVLPLIKALRTEHKFKIGGNANNMNVSFSRDPRGGLGGLAMGNRTRIVNKTVDNKSVRNALVALTDVDFGFNEPTWKAWYLARNSPSDPDLRRDP